MIVRSEVIRRTFRIKCGKESGTCFIIDVDSKQYLVTARHIVKALTGREVIEIYHDDKWKTLPVTLVGHGQGNIDVSVLAPSVVLSNPQLTVEPSGNDLAYSQEVFFLGFPFGIYGSLGTTLNNYPLPVAKKAIIASISNKQPEDIIILNGINNPGFSGGPVVFKPQGIDCFRFAAVVSGYIPACEPILHQGVKTPLVTQVNTGLIWTYSIRHAVDIINNNPIGCPTVQVQPQTP